MTQQPTQKVMPFDPAKLQSFLAKKKGGSGPSQTGGMAHTIYSPTFCCACVVLLFLFPSSSFLLHEKEEEQEKEKEKRKGKGQGRAPPFPPPFPPPTLSFSSSSSSSFSSFPAVFPFRLLLHTALSWFIYCVFGCSQARVPSAESTRLSARTPLTVRLTEREQNGRQSAADRHTFQEGQAQTENCLELSVTFACSTELPDPCWLENESNKPQARWQARVDCEILTHD